MKLKAKYIVARNTEYGGCEIIIWLPNLKKARQIAKAHKADVYRLVKV